MSNLHQDEDLKFILEHDPIGSGVTIRAEYGHDGIVLTVFLTEMGDDESFHFRNLSELRNALELDIKERDNED